MATASGKTRPRQSSNVAYISAATILRPTKSTRCENPVSSGSVSCSYRNVLREQNSIEQTHPQGTFVAEATKCKNNTWIAVPFATRNIRIGKRSSAFFSASYEDGLFLRFSKCTSRRTKQWSLDSLQSSESSENDSASNPTITNVEPPIMMIPAKRLSKAVSKAPAWVQKALAILSKAWFVPVGVTLLALSPAIAASASATFLDTALQGFTASLVLISLSEIGDKTFFISAILAMRYPRTLVLTGALGALSSMTVICILLAQVLQYLPPAVSHYGSILLLLFFGIRTIKQAWDMPSSHKAIESEEEKEAEEEVKQAVARIGTGGTDASTAWKIIAESFSLVFLAEWGDRSMLATIALATAKGPLGVMLGAVLGHAMTTGVAVIGGALLANYISDKVVGFIAGGFFILFAALTAAGVF